MANTRTSSTSPVKVSTIQKAIDEAYAGNRRVNFFPIFVDMLQNGLDYSEGNPIKKVFEYWGKVDDETSKRKRQRWVKKWRMEGMDSTEYWLGSFSSKKRCNK